MEQGLEDEFLASECLQGSCGIGYTPKMCSTPEMLTGLLDRHKLKTLNCFPNIHAYSTYSENLGTGRVHGKILLRTLISKKRKTSKAARGQNIHILIEHYCNHRENMKKSRIEAVLVVVVLNIHCC